jgi:mono/diheme cytochrome c family protein
MSTRMPTFHFTDQQAAAIERYFAEMDRVDYPYINTAIETDAETLRVGAELFTKLQCQSCHPTGAAIPAGKTAEDLAPDLRLASQRLRPDWVLQWLADPQKIFPGTRMPAFFASGQPNPFPNILGGDSQRQIKAIRDHMYINIGGARAVRSSSTTK